MASRADCAAEESPCELCLASQIPADLHRHGTETDPGGVLQIKQRNLENLELNS